MTRIRGSPESVKSSFYSKDDGTTTDTAVTAMSAGRRPDGSQVTTRTKKHSATTADTANGK